MKKILTLLFLIFSISTMAQTRSVKLTVKISADTGESLYRQKVVLKQTDFDVSYGSLQLNGEGELTLKVYPGAHQIVVERDGFVKLCENFTIGEDETERTVEYVLHEEVTRPYALATSVEHNAYTGGNTVMLTWNRQAPAFADDFENYDPFSISFGEWTGIDMDNEVAASLAGIYPNRGVMQYAQIINPLTVQPAWWYEYPILRPYEGKQYVGFTRTSSGNANNDWLISPVIRVGEHNILSFMAKAADQYPERFMVYVTTKTDNPQPEDFVRIDPGNYETADYTGWKECVYSLADYANRDIRFAIRYISEYNRYGSFMLMVDDVFVGQDMSEDNVNPNESFKIYVDGEYVATTSDTEYAIENLSAGEHTIGVKAAYTVAESDMTETVVNISSDSYAKVTFDVKANSILPTDGQPLQLVNTMTALTYELDIADGKAQMLSLPLGKYLLRMEQGAFKEYEKEIEITADATVEVVLEDFVVTPYNITADVEKAERGYNVMLRWNQILMFNETFDSYDDFATGSFGDWKTLDMDQMPVYPIGLGGVNPENIVSFPGASTYYDRKALAPLVFNPLKTQPAMIPTDMAIASLSGEKEILFMSPAQHKADKWLISPLINIYKDYVVEAALKSYDASYLESVDFCVSLGGDQPSDFVALSSADRIPAGEWTLYQTELSDYEGQRIRIGVHYKSYDTFMLQLDDFKVGPADGDTPQEDFGNIVRFDIYVDGKLVGSSTEPHYSLKGIMQGIHTIGVVAVYQAAESPMAVYEVNATTGIVKPLANDVDAPVTIYSVDGIQMPSTFTPDFSTTKTKRPMIIRQGNNVRKVIR